MQRSLLSLLRQPPIFRRAIAITPPNSLRTYHNTSSRTEAGKDTTWGLLEKNHPEFTGEAVKRTAEDIWNINSQIGREVLSKNPPANAYTGRSITVFNGNVAQAFKRLDQCLSRNRVKAELRLAERHEKKGAKRRRLESERWRIRFADEVRKKVALVKAIRRRGA